MNPNNNFKQRREKGFINILIFIIVLVLASTFGYFALVQRPKTSPVTQPTELPNETTKTGMPLPLTVSPTPQSPQIESTLPSPDRRQVWMIIFTHRGAPLPENIINFICNSVKSTVISWFDRELSKYNKQRPFSDIICYEDQILLSSENLLRGDLIWGEGVTFTNPINDNNVIKFLETKIPSINEIDYVTIFHYLVPTNLQFANHAIPPKYDFEFITNFALPDGNIAFIPPINQTRSIGDYAQELIHEFLHKLGATDKYSVGFKHACLVNPETGQQYNGYDIMCHRVSIPPAEGFATPPITELMITIPTYRELKLK